jgi:hypothetical protein
VGRKPACHGPIHSRRTFPELAPGWLKTPELNNARRISRLQLNDRRAADQGGHGVCTSGQRPAPGRAGGRKNAAANRNRYRHHAT